MGNNENIGIEFSKPKTEKITVRVDENELRQLRATAKENGIPFSLIVKNMIYKYNRGLVQFL